MTLLDERQRPRGCAGTLAVMLACALVSSPAHAQLTLETASQTRAPQLSARQMQLIPMVYSSGSVSGTDQADGEANDAILAAYCDDGWLTSRIPPQLGAYGYGLWDGFIVDKEAFRLNGFGIGDTRAEAEYPTRGGAASRLVGLKPDGEYLIYHRGKGLCLDGVTLCGHWDVGDASALKGDKSDYYEVGILQGCQQNGIGAGKIHAPSGLVLSCFKNGIQLGDSILGDNADQLNLASLRCPDSIVGIHSICRQSVGHWIGQFEGTRCGTMLYVERGGEFQIGQAILENENPTFLRTRASLWDDGTFHVHFLKVDGSVEGTAKLWQTDAHVTAGDDGLTDPDPDNPVNDDNEGFSSIAFTIDFLKIVAGVTNAPTVEMRGYQTFHVRGGGLLFDNFVTCHDGASSFYPVVIIENCKFRSGEDPSNVINETASDGKWRVVLRNNCSIGGVPYPDESFIATKSGDVVTRTPYVPEEIE